MALKISCPHCGQRHRLPEPYPLPGTEIQCRCGRKLAISYPPDLVERLRSQGARFQGEAAPTAAPTVVDERPPVARFAPPVIPPEDLEPTVIDRRRPRHRPRAEPPSPPSEPPSSPPRAAPRRRRRWLRGLVLAVVLCAAGGMLAAAGTIAWFRRDLPTLETLADYRPPTVTLVKDRGGRVLGEIYEKRRYVVPWESFPRQLVDAFVASEDASFWQHGGIDPMGIARALFHDITRREMAQGASTITQQVARGFLLTSEKHLARKIREMILARRIEQAFDKQHILWLYLNQIYLGSGAYGVEAASRIYFDKHVQDLTLAESALLAGLPQRPSDYSPHRHWAKARARQEYVLGQMVEKGFVTRAEAQAALAERVRIVRTENPLRIAAPFFTEHVRRHLVDTYGFDRVYNEGLVANTTCDLHLQQLAQRSVVDRVTRMDERFGWRGPVQRLQGDAAIAAFRVERERQMRERDRSAADPALREPLPERSTLDKGQVYRAVVLAVERKHAVVGVGRHQAMIPLSWTTWAYAPNPKRSWRYRSLDDLRKALHPGDVVDVRIEELDSQDARPLHGYGPAMDGSYAAARLVQEPQLQGAFLSFDLDTGAVRAMVGGLDIHKSEFNRAIQAQRQVGSTFKPIVYAAAIESRSVTTGSMVLDAPLTYNTLDEKLWKPGNYGEDYLGSISVRKALALSRNVCTVRVLDRVGIDPVYELARRLGISSHLEKDLSMGLGSSSLTMLELARAYSAFATYGRRVEPYFIESVQDRDGRVLERHEPAEFPEVLSPSVAGITAWLLQEVARSGTGAATNALGLHVAGKTGTTNDFKDAWFVGFSPGVLSAAWVGYDQPRSMGVSSTGGRVALPVWMDYMREAWPKAADHPFPEIPGVSWVPIDESTGRVARGGRAMPFLPGTVPAGPVVDVGQKSAQDLLTSDF